MKPEEIPAVGTRVTVEIKQPWDVYSYEMIGTIIYNPNDLVWIRAYRKRWPVIFKTEDIISCKVGWK